MSQDNKILNDIDTYHRILQKHQNIDSGRASTD